MLHILLLFFCGWLFPAFTDSSFLFDAAPSGRTDYAIVFWNLENFFDWKDNGGGDLTFVSSS